MIDHVTIEKIMDSSDIVDVIGEFVQLRRRGSNYLGLCPFHNEKTPSFTVSPTKQIFKCFGCGESGNVISFIKEHEKLNYYEALKFLAKKYGITVEEREITQEERDSRKLTESLAIVNEFAHKYFVDILKNNPEGQNIGIPYLKERKIREDIIEQFQIGYSTSSKNGLVSTAKSKGYKTDYLVRLGLAFESNGVTYDKLRERIIFPIHSLSGKVMAFGGRLIKKDEKAAKYINSPESELYTKGDNLYGLYFAKKTIISKDKCYLVEGYTDVLGLIQAGIENVVASQGTALTKNQIRLIHRFTSNLTVIYDGDAAGIKAALRGIDLILEQRMNVKIVLLPEGEDPDSISHKWSSSELIAYLNKNETDFIHFKINLLMQEGSNDPYKRSQMVNEIVQTISLIPDRITRTIYIVDAATQLKIDEQILYRSLEQIFYKKRSNKFSSNIRKKETTKIIPDIPVFISDQYAQAQEKELIRILLKYGNKSFKYTKKDESGKQITQEFEVNQFIIDNILNDSLKPEFKNIYYKEIFENFSKGHTDAKYYINNENDEIRKLSADLLSEKYIISSLFDKRGNYTQPEDKRLADLVISTMVLYKRKILEMYRDSLVKEIQTNKEDIDTMTELFKKLQNINIILKTLSEKYGWVVLK